ncbi:hypothetical protein D3C79_915330 [compost metagenome]
MGQRRTTAGLQAGKWHHAQAEAGVSLTFIVLDQADHHELHGQLRCLWVGAHQVEAGKLSAMGFQQVGKGYRAPFEANQGDAKVL